MAPAWGAPAAVSCRGWGQVFVQRGKDGEAARHGLGSAHEPRRARMLGSCERALAIKKPERPRRQRGHERAVPTKQRRRTEGGSGRHGAHCKGFAGGGGEKNPIRRMSSNFYSLQLLERLMILNYIDQLFYPLFGIGIISVHFIITTISKVSFLRFLRPIFGAHLK